MNTSRQRHLTPALLLIGSLFWCGTLIGACATSHVHSTQVKISAEPKDETVQLIVETILSKRGAYERLVTLCDTFGHRLSGSPELEQAIAWARDTLTSEGHDNVHLEAVKIPKWVRGEESAVMLTPRVEALHMLGLGMSLPTPPEGITAEVLTVADEEELEAKSAEVAGKIVHFNNPMPKWTPEEGACYGHTVRLSLRREHGCEAGGEGRVSPLRDSPQPPHAPHRHHGLQG